MIKRDLRLTGAPSATLALALTLGWGAACQAELVLIPVDPDNAIETSVDTGEFTGPAARTIDGSGLGTGFPTFPDTHTANNKDGWLSDGTGAELQWAMYDFEQEWMLNEIRFWNYHDFGGCCANRGVKDMDIYTSLDPAAMGVPDHDSWELLHEVRDTPIIPSQLQGEPPNPPYGERWRVNGTNTRLVMLDIVATWGANQVAISEIQFISDPGGITGDINDDGNVDLADFSILLSNLNSDSNVGADGDIDFSGRVDLRDFLQFRAAFAAQDNLAAAVPEPNAPTAIGTLVCAALLIWPKVRSSRALHGTGQIGRAY